MKLPQTRNMQGEMRMTVPHCGAHGLQGQVQHYSVRFAHVFISPTIVTRLEGVGVYLQIVRSPVAFREIQRTVRRDVNLDRAVDRFRGPIALEAMDHPVCLWTN